MPFRTKEECFEYPKRLDLPVLKEPPEGVEEGLSFGHKSLRTRYPAPFKQWFYCQHCEGWIEGEPHENEVNNLDGRRLAGRKGTEFWCIRCARQIGFSGMMS
jgi:hypothetical protein